MRFGKDIRFFQHEVEPKAVKNRMHSDTHVGGGRHESLEVRWPRVQAIVDKLVAAGGTVLRVDAPDGAPDHVTMADPEGNEFDVLQAPSAGQVAKP
ncbi:VOC family protein [Micromonospora chersina]|uniref:VOC family protein n=1 Tax=Micromonospora chersina TaxID=47854 RepID=UPI003CB649E3